MTLQQAINWKQTDSLFPAKEQYLMTHDKRGHNLAFLQLPKSLQRKKHIENMQIIANLPKTKINHFPIVHPYNGSIEYKYVSFTDRNHSTGKGNMLGFFLHDYKFAKYLWDKLEFVTASIAKFDVIFGPDISLFLGSEWEAQNKYNVYKSRSITAYWQYCGYDVIPVATWGDINSFKYCFEGLPERSVIVVCGIGHDKSPLLHRLWEKALVELQRQKNPTTIIIYGGKKCSISGLDTQLVFLEDFIAKKFRK